jgi:glycosyltransferase involved in cell wall biosynthesis
MTSSPSNSAQATLASAPSAAASPEALLAPASPPQVTVVIPCFNHGRFVAEAVRSCLAQKDADVHVVVVDDGSSDGTSPALCDACIRLDPQRVRVIRQENRGLPAARNTGARLASTEFLTFLDADDWLEDTFVSKLHAAIRAEEDAGRGGDVAYAYCQERLVGLGTGIWRVPDFDPVLMMLTNIHPVTTLIRRERFVESGGFNESMTKGYEDWDLWLGFVERGWRGVRVREPLFVWRRHSHATMIMRVIHDHERLYASIMQQHAALYARHASELLLRSNVLLRRCDMNWLDETGDPINLRALMRQKEMYESLLAVRAHRTIHRVISAMPAPLGRGLRGALGILKRLVPRSEPKPVAR